MLGGQGGSMLPSSELSPKALGRKTMGRTVHVGLAALCPEMWLYACARYADRQSP